MTLNSVIALVLLYFIESDSFVGLLGQSGTLKIYLNRVQNNRLPLSAKTDPPCSAV